MTLPIACPQCGAPVTDLHVSGTMEHRHARRLQRIAPFLAVLMVPVLYVWFQIYGDAIKPHLGWGFAFGWGVFGAIFSPSLAVYLISLLFPHVRRVSCVNCGWSSEVRVTR